jgi:hypothetical protein
MTSELKFSEGDIVHWKEGTRDHSVAIPRGFGLSGSQVVEKAWGTHAGENKESEPMITNPEQLFNL